MLYFSDIQYPLKRTFATPMFCLIKCPLFLNTIKVQATTKQQQHNCNNITAATTIFVTLTVEGAKYMTIFVAWVDF